MQERKIIRSRRSTDKVVTGNTDTIPQLVPSADKNPFTYSVFWPMASDVVTAMLMDKHAELFRSKRVSGPLQISSVETFCVAVESFCLFADYRDQKNVYDGIAAMLKEYVIEKRKQLDKHHDWRKMPCEEAMLAVSETWESFCRNLERVSNIFCYLDSECSLRGCQPLRDAGIELFGQFVTNSNAMLERCSECALMVIEAERDEGVVRNEPLLSNYIVMLRTLNICGLHFEKSFLCATSEYYQNEAAIIIRSVETHEYVRHVSLRVKQERTRAKMYFSTRTELLVENVISRALIIDKKFTLVDEGLGKLIDAGRLDELKTLYQYIITLADGLELIRIALIKYIKESGAKIVSNQENDDNMVQKLLQFSELFERIGICFDNNVRITHAIKDSLSHVVNIRPNKPAELIARYIDLKLRVGNKEFSNAQMEYTLDKILSLFRLINGKDVFEAFYKKDLAIRLLLDKSASIDSEKSMLSKLKDECGALFTNRLEGMFKDMETSKNLMEGYNEIVHARYSVPMTVSVLTLSFWPAYPKNVVQIPQCLLDCQQSFEAFYDAGHNGRVLRWQHSLCQCILKYQVNEKVSKELQASLFQALILLLFNTYNTLDCKTIEGQTGLTGSELDRTLQSLHTRKAKILLRQKSMAGKHGADIVEDEKMEYVLNPAFKHRLFRVRINQIQSKETPEENVATTRNVFRDRQFQIDAAVVRIMKAKKILNHNTLITELFKELKFPVTAGNLKERIDCLVDREYMKQDTTEESGFTYSYVS